MADSLQHKLDRVRRPRVQITYDVETNGSMKKTELPFVVGVMADLSGMPAQPLKSLKDRKVVNIDRDNFNEVMAKAGTRVAVKVDNELSKDGTKLAVELNFKSMEDFEPQRVAEQVGPLKELLEMRSKLVQLMSKMEGNDKLEGLLSQILTNTDAAQSLAQQMGVAPTTDEPPSGGGGGTPPTAGGGGDDIDPELAALLGQ